MAIQIKSVERPLPSTNGSKKGFYASPVHNGEISGNDLIEAIKNISSLNGADICAMLYAMEKVVAAGLAEGKIVRLGDLGSFRITLSSDNKATAKEVTATTVKKVGVIFTPGKQMKKTLNNAAFTKV